MLPDSTDAVFKVLSSDNLIYGPVNLATLVQWARERRVQRETWVFSETSNSWVAAESIDGVRQVFDAPIEASRAAEASSAPVSAVTVDELRQFERFAPYSNEELQLLIKFCDVVLPEKGDLIIKQGDLSDSLFLVLSGRVRAQITVGGHDTLLGTMDPGELFGEVAMLSQTARSADVVAAEPTRLLRLMSDRLRELIADHPSMATKILYNISRLLATRLLHRTTELQKDLSSSFIWR